MQIVVTNTYECELETLAQTFPEEYAEAESETAFLNEAISNLLHHDPHRLLTQVSEDIDIDA